MVVEPDLTAVDPIVWIVVGAVVLIIIVVLALLAARRRKSRAETRQRLQQRFGPEYERTVEDSRNRRAAEEDLLAREQRRASFTIRPVPPDRRDGMRARWEEVQAGFVDAPNASLRKADELLDEAATARGYPDASREQRLADLSVDHPAAVDRYCRARPKDDKDPSTERLREALLASRDLFEAMVSQGEPGSSESPPTPFQELIHDEPATPPPAAPSETTAPPAAAASPVDADTPPPATPQETDLPVEGSARADVHAPPSDDAAAPSVPPPPADDGPSRAGEDQRPT
jgi:hypothetical protein